MKNPWAYLSFGDVVATCDAHDRIEIIKKCTNPKKLRAYIKYPDTQKTVIQAAERRLRSLSPARQAASMARFEQRCKDGPLPSVPSV